MQVLVKLVPSVLLCLQHMNFTLLLPVLSLSDPSAVVTAAGPSSSAAAGRLSPPPVDPAELASGDFEVVHEDEDRRMVELLRAQVSSKADVQMSVMGATWLYMASCICGMRTSAFGRAEQPFISRPCGCT